MARNTDIIVLKSGREIYANHGIIGISNEASPVDGSPITEGYDSPIFLNELEDGTLDYTPAFTKEELKQLAGIMIRRWRKFRADVTSGKIKTK